MKNITLEFQEFIFENFYFDQEKKDLYLDYSLDNKIKFREIFHFQFNFVEKFSDEALEKALLGLWIMAGVSYFKTCLPPKIRIKNYSLNKEQADFFTKIYENGLGEFFFQNKLNPHNQIHFPVKFSISKEDEAIEKSIPLKNLQGTIVPIGGGKDSLVTAQILENNNVDFDTWHIGSSEIIKNCVKKIDKENFKISRKISPNLLELNKKGALNGHIPISAILSFLSVVSAILSGKKNIAFSNENSANFGNTVYQEKIMNHQFSKSLEFEIDFQNYVQKFISPDINYFSFLRPLSELKIAEIFAENCWDRFKNEFSSCNRNFHITKKADKKWCLSCPKCAFVGLILSPFLDKKKFCEIFTEEFFSKQELQKHFSEILGLSGHKPFECVGEIGEAQLAAKLAEKKYPELKKFTNHFPTPDFDKDKFHTHNMPEKFAKIWEKLDKKYF